MSADERLIFIFAGGSALGQVLSDTGTAKFLADRLVPLAGDGPLTAMVVQCPTSAFNGCEKRRRFA